MALRKLNTGIIGLGQMGSGIAVNLLRAGYSVTGYDMKPDAVARFVAAGGNSAANGQEIAALCDIVLTCVEGRDSISLADSVLLPNARSGQIFIDHSTVPAPETRRIGAAFAKAGCEYIDAPISGGRGGAEAGTLRIFVGGDKATVEKCWPLFETIGNPEKIVYCGPVGMGQIAKVVQQLTTRFPDVARMEVMAFGLQAGLDLGTLMRALDVSMDSNDPYARLCRAVNDGSIAKLSCEFAEWGYYLEEVRFRGFHMPMLEAMHEFCKNGEKVTYDALRRPEPSIWNELTASKRKPKVLLLGDSIRMSYQPIVAEMLKDCAEVVGPGDNCQFSLYTLYSLSRWVRLLGTPDIVHWNNGLHDVGHNPNRSPVQIPVEMYEMNLDFILKSLKSITPHVIWATSTPVHAKRPFRSDQWSWRKEEIDQYNLVASNLMNRNGVPINDLHSLIAQDPDRYFSADHVHLSEEGKAKCAEAVAGVIREYIHNMQEGK